MRKVFIAQLISRCGDIKKIESSVIKIQFKWKVLKNWHESIKVGGSSNLQDYLGLYIEIRC